MLARSFVIFRNNVGPHFNTGALSYHMKILKASYSRYTHSHSTSGGSYGSGELQTLQSLLQAEYSAKLYGRKGAINASLLQLVYLSMLPEAALQTIRDRVGVCTLATGLTPAGDSSWRCADLGCFPACRPSGGAT